MTGLRKIAACVVVAARVIGAGFVAAGARVGTAVAAPSPAADQDAKQKEKKLAAGEAEARRLLLLLDRDQNGKVSKTEFMKVMKEEFARTKAMTANWTSRSWSTSRRTPVSTADWPEILAESRHNQECNRAADNSMNPADAICPSRNPPPTQSRCAYLHQEMLRI